MRGLLSLLNHAYLPFVGFLGFLQFALAGLFLYAAFLDGSAIYAFLGFVFFFMFCWYLVPMYQLLTSQPDPRWVLELKVSREEAPEIYEIADDVAERCRLPQPDEIRLSPITDAAAFQTKGGRQVLVLGALTIASFPVSVVESIIAHELAHMGGGDTAMLREMRMTCLAMGFTRHYLLYQSWKMISLHNLDGLLPYRVLQLLQFLLWGVMFLRYALRCVHVFLWATFLYQWVFDIVFAAASREEEYDADQAAVHQAGPEDTAAMLFYIHVAPLVPKTSFVDMLFALAQAHDFERRVFTAQVNEVRSASKSAWKKAMKKALKEKTRLFDSHPSLGDRLRAIGVKPDEALELAWEMEGEPAGWLVENWGELERKLTIWLVARCAHIIEDNMSFGELVAEGG